VVIVETLFNYKGFGWTLVEAAGNNDIELLLGVSVVSVVVVLLTQLSFRHRLRLPEPLASVYRHEEARMDPHDLDRLAGYLA
jgi:ABC-type antimicrobial peptide transport system permease subunit